MISTYAMNAPVPTLDLLQQRNSAPRLAEPAPTGEELEEMLRCALRTPDHCWLRPWRFVGVRGERRGDLGALLEQSLVRSNPEADAAARAKARGAPLRAPLVLVVMAAISEHPKVPEWEQRVSAGCAAFAVELAAEALGYAAIWRTGAYTRDAQLVKEFGGEGNEEIVAFLYIGTRDGDAKAVPALEPSDFYRAW